MFFFGLLARCLEKPGKKKGPEWWPKVVVYHEEVKAVADGPQWAQRVIMQSCWESRGPVAHWMWRSSLQSQKQS